MNRQQLIEDNMNLVYFIVSHEYPTYLYDEDIVQSGMLGLCLAAENFDEEKGEFSNYAGKRIRGEIKKEFVRRKRHSKNVSLASTVNDEYTLGELIAGKDDTSCLDDEIFYSQLTKEELNILTMNNIGFSTDEIAEMSGYSVQKVQKMLRVIRIKWRNFYGD